MIYSDFFKIATGHNHLPYNWQERLATSEACESRLIDIPTGLGKTAGVILAWLWNRLKVKDGQKSSWPRRLVYCLPMRTLVEQTEGEAQKWIHNLWMARDSLDLSNTATEELRWLSGNGDSEKSRSPIILMGGEDLLPEKREWDLYPERPAILIGTQDMLLSRALNRGYGMARARWPMHFALLNNDVLWVMDEAQLMDVGLATSAQLQAYRLADRKTKKNLLPCLTWWMSATLQADWIDTVDTHQMVEPLRTSIVEIPAEERQDGIWEITKPCEIIKIPNETKWAINIWDEHNRSASSDYGRITLVIVNTVKKACKLHEALQRVIKKNKTEFTDLHLIHSRFRPRERTSWKNGLLSRSACTPTTDRIIIATQIVEAGVDISATTLFSELAPWPSLVQRFGRAARYGGTANIFVVDSDPTEKSALPYSLYELVEARMALAHLPDASLNGLNAFKLEQPEIFARLFPYSPLHLLLRREVEELFDTTPDLSGADLDISRFIRSGDERDVLVFWRDLSSTDSPPVNLVARREELCPVPIGDARDWCTKGSAKNHTWIWDYLDGRWRKASRDDLYPGQTLLVEQSAGGYHPDLGWTGDSVHRNFAVESDVSHTNLSYPDSTAASDKASEGIWQSIMQHSAEVAAVAQTIVISIDLPPIECSLFDIAARWHDIGKAHPAFQASINSDADGHPKTADIAKAPQSAWRAPRDLYRLPNGERRTAFRHELASTLALFDVLLRHMPNHAALLGPHRELFQLLGQPERQPTATDSPTSLEQEILSLDEPSFNLLAYIVCTHHGKVRTAWHTTPADQTYRDRDGCGLPLHGIREGDQLNTIDLATSKGMKSLQATNPLTLEPARLGLSHRTGSSWAERVGSLLLQHGPFALAYFETLFRAADARASASQISASH
jgi:CRISPR-associated endonuclease/helicase Cas3